MKGAHRTPAQRLPGARLLLALSPYYADIAAMLLQGAQRAVEEAAAVFELVEVPGAFELPGAIAIAARRKAFDGYVALGCVVRGETNHYDYVCGESARGLMNLSIRRRLPIGYGILTVDTLAQAEERADPARGDKGGGAVKACLAMIALKRRFSETGP